MKNLFLLKTEKHIKNVGDLVKDKYGDIHIFTKKDSKEYGKTIAKLNIYITSDEKIKDEDYFLNIAFDTVHTNGSTIDSQYCKKIILTTDQDLIKDGVQAIDDEFLEWFVKNPSCEELKIGIEIWNDGTFSYKIIIPKEEPKQETLEEVGMYQQELFNYLCDLGITALQSEMQEIERIVLNMQQEQDKNKYSKEEVLNFTQTILMQYKFGNTNIEQLDLLKETLEQFEKK